MLRWTCPGSVWIWHHPHCETMGCPNLDGYLECHQFFRMAFYWLSRDREDKLRLQLLSRRRCTSKHNIYILSYNNPNNNVTPCWTTILFAQSPRTSRHNFLSVFDDFVPGTNTQLGCNAVLDDTGGYVFLSTKFGRFLIPFGNWLNPQKIAGVNHSSDFRSTNAVNKFFGIWTGIDPIQNHKCSGRIQYYIEYYGKGSLRAIDWTSCSVENHQPALEMTTCERPRNTFVFAIFIAFATLATRTLASRWLPSGKLT